MTKSNVQLLLGDARKLDLPDNSVDLIITHPPYFGIEVSRYGGNPKDQINFERDRKKMLKMLTQAVLEMQRVLKPSGSLIIANGPNEQIDLRILVDILNKTKFGYVDCIVHNSYGLEPEQSHARAEAIVSEALTTWHHFSLSPHFYFNPFLVKRYNNPVWNLTFSNMADPVDVELAKKYHVYDVMNKEIPKRFIEMFSQQGDTVLDPFGGSAIVAVTAAEMKRKGISNDISEDQMKAAKDRIKITFGE